MKYLLLLIPLCILGCDNGTGPEGPAGPSGPRGPNGVTTQGSSVTYQEWSGTIPDTHPGWEAECCPEQFIVPLADPLLGEIWWYDCHRRSSEQTNWTLHTNVGVTDHATGVWVDPVHKSDTFWVRVWSWE